METTNINDKERACRLCCSHQGDCLHIWTRRSTSRWANNNSFSQMLSVLTWDIILASIAVAWEKPWDGHFQLKLSVSGSPECDGTGLLKLNAASIATKQLLGYASHLNNRCVWLAGATALHDAKRRLMAQYTEVRALQVSYFFSPNLQDSLMR